MADRFVRDINNPPTNIYGKQLRNWRRATKKNATDQWSLQKAIAIIFGRFLEKSSTLSNWSCGLDSCLLTGMSANLVGERRTHYHNKQKQLRQTLIKYAVDDCLAVTLLLSYIRQDQESKLNHRKITMEIQDNHQQQQQDEFNQQNIQDNLADSTQFTQDQHQHEYNQYTMDESLTDLA
ncbi:unnamed protein product [Didymodactylos carnosus]|uniref:Uncharacterized protein n=1 Tax=Didymodactylos carnosus TaxID=1234261 RepID=A0A8S2E1L7_9BILA|nr:unnamed protein product [Didymodactylos carnosus]CAF3813885.1 unnamed protein product [Didymodactylos carnosus]